LATVRLLSPLRKAIYAQKSIPPEAFQLLVGSKPLDRIAWQAFTAKRRPRL
jgi:hypothetical protein